MTMTTNGLAAKILRAKGRGMSGTFSAEGGNYRNGYIDGLCTAWEDMTGLTADEESLQAAADAEESASIVASLAATSVHYAASGNEFTNRPDATS